MKKAEKFKHKGENILKNLPTGIKDFLYNSPLKDENTHPHNSTKPQISISKEEKEDLGRLHIQIRQNLIDKIVATVFKRKSNPKIIKRNATQRAVIEEALEMYFDKNPAQSVENQIEKNIFYIENN